ncbi:hypothetical protein ACKWTF_009968 [Chironomus riparius]
MSKTAGLFVRNPNFVAKQSEERENEDLVASNRLSDDSGVSEDITASKNKSKKRKTKAKDGNKSKKHKTSDEKLTAEQINEMKESEELYHSNMFRMQIDETLKEIKLKCSQEEFINKWLTTFKKFLNKLPNENISGLLKHDDYPMRAKLIEEDKKFQMTYQSPKDAFLYGSYALSTNIGNDSAVDIHLIVPDESFKKSDYLNHIFIHKKTLYLWFIAKKLKEKGTLGGNIKVIYLKNDPLKPVLMIDAEEFHISITASISQEFFKLNRFVPKTNNIKLKDVEESTTPTPHYNFNILYDCTIERNQRFIFNEINKFDNVKNAIKLLKIWIHQREFDTGFYPFNGFIVTNYLIHLIKVKKIYPTMSCYQIVRLFWNLFGHSKLDINGISLCTEKDLSNQPSIQDFHEFYDVVMVDNSGYCNILSFLSVDLYRKVRNECLNAIKVLDNKLINSFQQLFLTKIPYYLQYDHFISIKWDCKTFDKIIEKNGSDEDKIDYRDSPYPHVRKLIMNVLRKGLGERVTSLIPVTHNQSYDFNIGIILNPEHAFNIVEKGPQSNQPESEEFRKFWGNKSEIRRFKDGSITESILWCNADAPIAEKRIICQKIVTFLLKHHFNIINDKIVYNAKQFDIVIRSVFNELDETNEERSLAAIRAFDEMSKELRNLNDLPLEIVSVLGTDPVFRYTDVTPPNSLAKTTNSGFINKSLRGRFLTQKTLNGVIQLAPSGKWPDNIDAMKRIKAAFYIEISKKMSSKYPSTSIQVMPDCVEILKDKFVFKLKIVHPKEIALAKEEISTKNNLSTLYKANEESNRLEFENVLLPKLNSFLHGLHCRFPSYGPTVAIAKRWLYSQMIDSYLWPDECTELLVAEMFLKNHPVEPSCQPQIGFLRFLQHLATFSFENDMVVVNFNDDMDAEQIDELEVNFRKNRKNFPPIFIATSCDSSHQYGIWSTRAPSIYILKRVQLLAQCSVQIVAENFTKLNMNVVKDLFTTSLEGYNLFIHLNDKYIKKVDIVRYNFTNFKPVQLDQKMAFSGGIDFVDTFLKELRSAFDDIAIFFYNPIGSNKIAVLWKQSIKERKKFAASHLNMCKVINELLEVNVDAILNDIQIIGKGLIESIEIIQD